MTGLPAEVPAEIVEKAAQALWRYDYRGHTAEWFEKHDPEKWHYDRTRIALSAVWPDLQALVVSQRDEATYDDGWGVALEPIRAAARHPHKGPVDMDGSMLFAAAKRLEDGYPVGGQHTTATVARVLRAVAERVDS